MHSDRTALWGAVRELAKEPFVVLDTETTGLTAPEAVSIAVVDAAGRPLIHRLIRPGKAIEPGASRITGIDAATVADAPTFASIEPELTAILRNRTVAIYNADYDTQVLRNTYARYGLSEPPYRPWCVMKWFARVFGEWNPSRNDFKWQSLPAAAAYFRISQESAHDALDDCMTTWRILQAALRKPEA